MQCTIKEKLEIKKFIFDNLFLSDTEHYSEELKEKLFNDHFNKNSFNRGMLYRLILEKIKHLEVLGGW